MFVNKFKIQYNKYKNRKRQAVVCIKANLFR